jgi:hypothetical protein
MRLTSRKKRSAIAIILFHDFVLDDAIFFASYIIAWPADFLGSQQHCPILDILDVERTKRRANRE